jgi:uncharacterized protein (TIGR03382 family)
VVFVFSITGSGAAVADFTTALSTGNAGPNPAIAAAKFIDGPGGDKAYGAFVPGPGAAALALLALAGRSRRRRD